MLGTEEQKKTVLNKNATDEQLEEYAKTVLGYTTEQGIRSFIRGWKSVGSGK